MWIEYIEGFTVELVASIGHRDSRWHFDPDVLLLRLLDLSLLQAGTVGDSIQRVSLRNQEVVLQLQVQ